VVRIQTNAGGFRADNQYNRQLPRNVPGTNPKPSDDTANELKQKKKNNDETGRLRGTAGHAASTGGFFHARKRGKGAKNGGNKTAELLETAALWAEECS